MMRWSASMVTMASAAWVKILARAASISRRVAGLVRRWGCPGAVRRRGRAAVRRHVLDGLLQDVLPLIGRCRRAIGFAPPHDGLEESQRAFAEHSVHRPASAPVGGVGGCAKPPLAPARCRRKHVDEPAHATTHMHLLCLDMMAHDSPEPPGKGAETDIANWLQHQAVLPVDVPARWRHTSAVMASTRCTIGGLTPSGVQAARHRFRTLRRTVAWRTAAVVPCAGHGRASWRDGSAWTSTSSRSSRGGRSRRSRAWPRRSPVTPGARVRRHPQHPGGRRVREHPARRGAGPGAEPGRLGARRLGFQVLVAARGLDQPDATRCSSPIRACTRSRSTRRPARCC